MHQLQERDKAITDLRNRVAHVDSLEKDFQSRCETTRVANCEQIGLALTIILSCAGGSLQRHPNGSPVEGKQSFAEEAGEEFGKRPSDKEPRRSKSDRRRNGQGKLGRYASNARAHMFLLKDQKRCFSADTMVHQRTASRCSQGSLFSESKKRLAPVERGRGRPSKSRDARSTPTT